MHKVEKIRKTVYNSLRSKMGSQEIARLKQEKRKPWRQRRICFSPWYTFIWL